MLHSYHMIEADVAEYFPQRHKTWSNHLRHNLIIDLYTFMLISPLQVCRAPWWSRLDSLWLLPLASQYGGDQTDAWSLQWRNHQAQRSRVILQILQSNQRASGNTETLKTYKPLVKTFPWRCPMLNFYMSSQQQTRLDSPRHRK